MVWAQVRYFNSPCHTATDSIDNGLKADLRYHMQSGNTPEKRDIPYCNQLVINNTLIRRWRHEQALEVPERSRSQAPGSN